MIFIKLLLNYLGNEQNRGPRFHAFAIIPQVVAGSTNRKVVKQYTTPSIILDLVSSKDRELQVQAMWLLHTIALGILDHHEIETILEKALDPVISFHSDGSPSPEMIYLGALTLATFCQVYPNLPQEKSKLVPLALRNLIQYDTEQHLAEANLPYVCMALTYLCDGREAMVVEDYFFGEVIDHLIVIIDSDSRLLPMVDLEQWEVLSDGLVMIIFRQVRTTMEFSTCDYEKEKYCSAEAFAYFLRMRQRLARLC